MLGRIGEALDRRWLTNDGPLLEEFEKRVADLIGVRHCVAVSSGTMGLVLAARAAELAAEVIVPSFTFVGTAHALLCQGITPVFCDIDPSTHTIDPARVEERITPHTSGILAVHLWGRPCDVEALGRVENHCALGLIKFRNMQFIGEVHYTRLPEHMRTWTAALIPIVRIAFTDAADLVTFYEYFSMGLTIVSTDIWQVVQRFGGLVYRASDSESFSNALAQAFLEAGSCKRAQRTEIESEETWRRRAKSLLAALGVRPAVLSSDDVVDCAPA